MVDKTSSSSNNSLGYIIADDINLLLKESDGHALFVSAGKMNNPYEYDITVNVPQIVPIASLASQQKHKMKTSELTSPFVMVNKTSSP